MENMDRKKLVKLQESLLSLYWLYWCSLKSFLAVPKTVSKIFTKQNKKQVPVICWI